MNTEMPDGEMIAAVGAAGFKRGASILQHRIEADSLALEQTQNVLHPDYVVKAVRNMILTVLDLRLLVVACEGQVRAAGVLLSDAATREQVTEVVAYVIHQTAGAMARILPSWMTTVREGWPEVYSRATKGMALPESLDGRRGVNTFRALLLSSAAVPGGLLTAEK